MGTAKRSDPQLWEAVKAMVMLQGGPWSARKAQQAVLAYKKAGGTYVGPKRADNSLSKWTAEEWDYVAPAARDKRGRFLPKKVRERLTPAQQRATNRRKRAATARGEVRAPYSSGINALMRSAGIY